ncbi:Hypothetical protein NTJ_01702 [Nesidiocoris tenuis]|uniref:Uncharacterized protein n=1 Tax=Nesidiocoris tenuis TaxID=355587 RepID=A0ABN7A9K6_9HEMI|nr:Hypothetical protein NTJ_01702 [Nesidiocoris tenuis]
MKLSLFFVFVAAYGVIAQEDVSSGAAVSSKISIGALIQKTNSTIQAGLDKTKEAVLDALDIGDSAVQLGASLGANIVSNGTKWAKDGVGIAASLAGEGINLASSLTKETLNLVEKFPGGRLFPANTIGRFANSAFNLANKGVNGGKKVAESGIGLGNTVGQGVAAAVSAGSTVITSGLSSLENAKMNMISKATSNSLARLNNGINRFGKGVENAGKIIKESATLPTEEA